MRRGVRLGVDVGSVRVGVARSDRDGLLATPVETVQRTRDDDGAERIAELARELEAVEVVVGLPRSLDGKERAAANLAKAYARRLAPLVAPAGVRMVDERFSTTTAQRAMTAAGRRAKDQRAVVDQVAAVVLLQAALDEERAGHAPRGRIVAATTTEEKP